MRSAAIALPGVDTLPPEHLRQKALSQWWTPADAAARIAAWCGSLGGINTVLEPAAGDGALIRALCGRPGGASLIVDAVEIDPRHIGALRAGTVGAGFYSVKPECGDYLARPAPAALYDLSLANTPYEDGLDSLFVEKMMSESLRVVALVRLAMLETQRTHERVWSRLGADGWHMPGLAIFTKRPVFIAPGASSTGGMTAFAAVKLSRVGTPAATHVEWW